jgi:hypothetical protein
VVLKGAFSAILLWGVLLIILAGFRLFSWQCAQEKGNTEGVHPYDCIAEERSEKATEAEGEK